MKIKAREITRATCFKWIDEINSATQITPAKKRRDGTRMALHLATLDKIIRQDNSRWNRDRGKTFDPTRARPAVGPSSRIPRPVSPRREQRCREIRCWWPDLFGSLIINNIYYATSISSFFRLFFILSFLNKEKDLLLCWDGQFWRVPPVDPRRQSFPGPSLDRSVSLVRRNWPTISANVKSKLPTIQRGGVKKFFF